MAPIANPEYTEVAKKKVKCFNCKKKSKKIHVQLYNETLICEQCIEICMNMILNTRYHQDEY